MCNVISIHLITQYTILIAQIIHNLFQEKFLQIGWEDGYIEYAPAPGVFHSARNDLRCCFPGYIVCMQVFNVAELNIFAIRK
jgi:hypothetical protein